MPMRKYIKEKFDIFKIASACVFITFFLGLIIFMLLFLVRFESLENIELPAVFACR